MFSEEEKKLGYLKHWTRNRDIRRKLLIQL
jgi:hypothetical protein